MNVDNNIIASLYESVKNHTRVSKVVIINDNKVLMVQKNGSLKWELPGGHVEPGESMKLGAIREVTEETGRKLDKAHLSKISTIVNDKSKSISNIYLYNRPINNKIKLSSEHVNYKWVTQEDLDKLELSPSTNHLAIMSAFVA